MRSRFLQLSSGALAVAAALALGSLPAAAPPADAAAVGSAGGAPAAPTAAFQKAQQQLETQLADRQQALGRLSADVTAAKELSASDATLLNGRLGSETASIAALVAKVPADTTVAELRADRQAMLRDNRVYAVMTPQVVETIEASSITASLAPLQAEQAGLLESVTSLVGQPGYRTAAAHYRSFVASLQRAATDSADVTTKVLAQVPADFPGDTPVFVQANRRLLAANVAIAYAEYDVSVIGLASGGYTGS